MTGASINPGSGTGNFTCSYWGGTDINVLVSTTQSIIASNISTVNGPNRFNIDDEPTLAEDLLVSGSISGGGAFQKNGDGTLFLTGSNTSYTGGFDVQGGALKIDSLANRIGTGYLALKGGTLLYTGTGIETAANPFWVDGAGVAGTIDIVNAGAVLSLNPASGTVNQQLIKNGPGRLVLQGVISGAASITANGGRLDLQGVNTYTGETIINTGATVVMSYATLDDAATLSINGSGKLNLDHGTNDLIGALNLNGVPQAGGKTYGATGSGADVIDDAHFTGTGTVQVAGGDYDTWETQYGIAGAGGAADSDNDGLNNDEEYAFGLDPTSGASVSPITVQLNKATGTFTYTRRDDALTGLSYKVWTSPDLTTWTEDATATQDDSAGPDANGVEPVVVKLTTAPTGARFFVRVSAGN
jgi:autotransporter-associated beta strand protein